MRAQGLAAAGRDSAQRILDFGCGHGRVMRALRAAFPDAELTACDLDEDGVRFCAERFAALGVVSRPEIPLISLPRGYDAIWCGSVLTHLAAPRWKQLLDRFAEWLAPGGVLVFTTHGQLTVDTLRARHWSYGLADAEIDAVLAKYDHAGFGYIMYPGQANYGFSSAHPCMGAGIPRNVRHPGPADVRGQGMDGPPGRLRCERVPHHMSSASPTPAAAAGQLALGDLVVNRIGLGARFIQDAAHSAPLLQRALELGVNRSTPPTCTGTASPHLRRPCIRIPRASWLQRRGPDPG